MTDGDGDTATATVNFQVTDANAPTASPAVAAVDDDGLIGPPAGNPASTTGDLNANIGDNPANTSEATFSGHAGRQRRRRRRRGQRLHRFAALNGTDGHGRHRDGDLQLGWRHNTLTATGPARRDLFTVVVTAVDRRLHGDAARQRAARWRPNDEATDADSGADLHGHRCGRLDRDQHADHHLRRRRADGDDHATQNVAEGATVTGTLDFVQGADGATVTHIDGTALVFDAATDFSQAIDIGPDC